MSEWKSFATNKPCNGKTIIAMHEQVEIKYSGVYIEYGDKTHLVVIDDIDTGILGIKTKMLPLGWFTHWKEI